MMLALLTGLGVGSAILLAAGRATIDTVMLAIVGAATFADLTRRGLRERGHGWNDPTDVGLSIAFAGILVGAGYDVGRGSVHELSLPFRLAFAGGGIAIITGGVWLRQRAARALGENFLVRLGVREGHTLVRSGPFRFVRHPSYAALLVIALGTALAFASPTAALVTIAVWLPVMVLRIAREERLLSRRFGQEFETYRRRTRKLIPGLW